MPSNTREKMLDVAERLFTTRGYDSVRLRDIADELGIKHAALYYHAPGGKEQIYVDVMKRSLKRHHQGMTAALSNTDAGIRQQMHAVADWLLSQPAMNITQMEQSDFAAIDETSAAELSTLVYNSLRQPLRNVLAKAQQAGTVQVPDVDLAAISFIVLIESVHASSNPYLVARKQQTVKGIIDMLLNGWLAR